MAPIHLTLYFDIRNKINIGIKIKTTGGITQNDVFDNELTVSSFMVTFLNNNEGIDATNNKKYAPTFQPIYFATKYA
jgi:hypothetical protein